MIFLIELFYKLEVRIEVFLHHLITAVLFIILLIGASQNFGTSGHCLRLGLVLILMALTDHPLNFTLLLKNLGYAETKWWPRLCQISGIVFVVTKLILTGMAIYIVANKDDNTFLIPSHSFSNWLSYDASLGETSIIILILILYSSSYFCLFKSTLGMLRRSWVMRTRTSVAAPRNLMRIVQVGLILIWSWYHRHTF